MTFRLVLVSPAFSRSLREARFDDGAPLEPAGLAAARAAAPGLHAADRYLASPTARCRETATALGVAAHDTAELAALDVGRWRGRTLAEVGAAEPEAVGAWLTDPAAAPHGGEPVRALCARATAWLAAATEDAGRTLAVVEPEIVRALVLRALDAPESAFWRIDVPPLTATELTGRSGRWNLRAGRPLTP
ncbi:Adenosylcobalamin/alpha-ribazole phosphatase [Streptomyces hundungensis]|uniref:Adenosylcobalamin/alpha-ribazole phosphatase n=1 Tax=Streptomyces hundungensis TaxID=1077946 RepID=A0A387HGX6_9ACTN|nr:histidine phosphatase family protein [Streptomyces hundungensis]AYG81911.1 Adenosylcobalamin/alpha-ribazole phosphatase [Streptomyces hundungensis]